MSFKFSIHEKKKYIIPKDEELKLINKKKIDDILFHKKFINEIKNKKRYKKKF